MQCIKKIEKRLDNHIMYFVIHLLIYKQILIIKLFGSLIKCEQVLIIKLFRFLNVIFIISLIILFF